MQRNFTHTINPEEKTNSQSYIQQLLSYPKKSFIYSKAVLKPYVESLSYRKIADSIKLIVALNALDYLPKVKADEIYVLLDKIHYALSFDKTGPLHTLTTQLLDACQNITLFNDPQTNYTEFFKTGCVIEGDKRLSMLIETGNNNTQFLLNCTMDLVNSINESCDGDKKLLAFVIAVFAVAILACLCGCVARYTCGTLQLTNSETESTELAPRLTRSSALPNSANQPETNTSVSNLEVVSGLTKLSILSHSNNQPGEEITPNPRNTPDTEKNETSNNQPYERNDIRLYT